MRASTNTMMQQTLVFLFKFVSTTNTTIWKILASSSLLWCYSTLWLLSQQNHPISPLTNWLFLH
ncbi:Uncharacterized protein TCM_031970 [Theobroma cacao]|uniref:Uncharacterized protein n=1 Tax=Theobroma cacao TaxID=3641 RepID=A0A061F936_THECC|nr:Uncharacterized protein TCM_031970 [Theobroma cacao]